MKIKFLVSIIVMQLVVVAGLKAQSDFVQLGTRQYQFLDRMDVLLRNDSVYSMSSVKPFDRKEITERAWYLKAKADEGEIELTEVDKYNLDILLKENFDWKKDIGDTAYRFNNLWKKTVWQMPYAYGIRKEDFSFLFTPLFNYGYGKESQTTKPLMINTRGFMVRGNINKNIGYYSYISENQEGVPAYVQNMFVGQIGRQALPGHGYIKTFQRNEIGYYDVKGGIMFKAGRHIDIQFANDKVFIGNGIRSLILSDFAENILFLKVKAKFWKFQYYNLWGQLTSNFSKGGDYLRPTKYMAFHYLELQATSKLNVALFENIMMSRENGIDINYLNPIISYNAVQAKIGSPDKLTIGFNLKYNLFKKTQLYSQLIINEFTSGEIRRWNNGYWGNKLALQIGAKHYNLFGIKNLDIQGEVNLIRPFVYTHYDTAKSYYPPTSFTHYNQPLAHPLGANLKEFIFTVNYQPAPKWNINAKLFYVEQGQDSGKSNYGSNIFLNYNLRSMGDYGYSIGTGVLAKTFYGSFNASYELLPNFFVDGKFYFRTFSRADGRDPYNATAFMFGVRWNLPKRDFEF